jgi:hypothetical protein
MKFNASVGERGVRRVKKDAGLADVIKACREGESVISMIHLRVEYLLIP